MMTSKITLTAVFQEAEEGGYVVFLEEIPGVNTQGDTIEQTRVNLLEALNLVLETQRMQCEQHLRNAKFIRENIDFTLCFFH